MAQGIFTLKQVVQGIQQNAWINRMPFEVEYLVVAGGGAGGNGQGGLGTGGGGGAGGLLADVLPVTAGTSYRVTVGAGGAAGTTNSGAVGPSGSNSVFGPITTLGGGGGGGAASSVISNGISGGSGGGAGRAGTGTSGGGGIFGQGNAGGRSVVAAGYYGTGGGGGHGTVGRNGNSNGGGHGGAGIASVITGSVATYAGGGGGSSYSGAGTIPGGAGGGGAGSTNTATVAGAGTVNTGGGGGAGGTSAGQNDSGAGAGGSGIVVLSYPDTYAAATSTTGSPTVSTSGSGSIAGTTATHFYYAGQSAFVLATGDFTIECWVYFNNFTTYPTIVDFRDSSNAGNGISLYAYNTGVLTLYANGADRISGATLSTGQWYHIAVTRSGTVTKMFLNGTQTGSSYTDNNNYTCGAASPVFMANGAKSSGALNGSVSNIRIVKGTALYTTTFTPSTTPLTVVSGTSVLLNAVSGAFLADGSTNSFVANVSAQVPTWSALSPFTGTGYKNRVYIYTTSGSITF